ncbi:MAG TPA: hypothetical protein VHF22_12820, partial [Planctomycetota bacterium]|nr:hypothetical protein [Planctomycetota bacterium]
MRVVPLSRVVAGAVVAANLVFAVARAQAQVPGPAYAPVFPAQAASAVDGGERGPAGPDAIVDRHGLARDGDTVWLLYHAFATGPSGYVAKSVDGGASFGTPVDVVAGASVANLWYRASIAARGQDVYVGFT